MLAKACLLIVGILNVAIGSQMPTNSNKTNLLNNNNNNNNYNSNLNNNSNNNNTVSSSNRSVFIGAPQVLSKYQLRLSPEEQSLVNSYKQIGEYRIIAFLGAGGLGSVFLAQSSVSGQQVAIKLIRVKRYNQLPSLVSELVALRRVTKNGSNCCGILSSRMVGSNVAIVMPYYAGGTLEAFLKLHPAPLPKDQMQAVIEDVANALIETHEQNIAHLDVKPANIFIDKTTGQLVLGDFGLARAGGSRKGDEPVSWNLFCGSLLYAAPEAVRLKFDRSGTAPPITQLADMWSLGVIMYRAMTGELPYQASEVPGESLTSLARRQYHLIQANPINVHKLANLNAMKQTYGDKCVDLMQSLLQLDPFDRLTPYKVIEHNCFEVLNQSSAIAAFKSHTPPSPDYLGVDERLLAHATHQASANMLARFNRVFVDMTSSKAALKEDPYLPYFDSKEPDGFLDAPWFSLEGLLLFTPPMPVSSSTTLKTIFTGSTARGPRLVEMVWAGGLKHVSFGNELQVLQDLKLVDNFYPLHQGNLVIVRRDTFACPLVDFSRLNRDQQVRESLIADLVTKLSDLSRQGILVTHVRPESLGVRPHGMLDILDYSSAVHLGKAKMLVGYRLTDDTIPFSPPEMIGDHVNGKSFSHKQNVNMQAWMAGAIAFYIGCGRGPFGWSHGTNLVDHLNTMRTQPINFNLLDGKVSPAVIDVVRGLLIVDPAKRMPIGVATKALAGFRQHKMVAALLINQPKPPYSQFINRVNLHMRGYDPDAVTQTVNELVNYVFSNN